MFESKRTPLFVSLFTLLSSTTRNKGRTQRNKELKGRKKLSPGKPKPRAFRNINVALAAILELLTDFFSVSDVLALCCTCWAWNKLYNTNLELWQRLFSLTWPQMAQKRLTDPTLLRYTQQLQQVRQEAADYMRSTLSPRKAPLQNLRCNKELPSNAISIFDRKSKC